MKIHFNSNDSKNIRILFTIFYLIFFLKFIAVLFIIEDMQETFSDSSYYDAYAKNLANNLHGSVANGWPTFLRFLYQIGMYSRSAIVVIIFILGNIIIPLQVSSLSQARSNKREATYWLIAIAISMYASIFYLSLDILRDIPALFIYLLAISAVKSMFNMQPTRYVRRMRRYSLYMRVCLLGIILFSLRNYLGAAYFISIALCQLSHKNRKPLLIFIIIGMIFCNILFSLGMLEKIIAYRSIFLHTHGGSDLGIYIQINDSIPAFNYKLFISFCYQMLGLCIYSIESLFFFIFESLPFAVCLYLVIKKTGNPTNDFISFLIIFFFLYSFIWTLGNDNLGTAIRLRIFSYIPIFIASILLYRNQRCNLLDGHCPHTNQKSTS